MARQQQQQAAAAPAEQPWGAPPPVPPPQKRKPAAEKVNADEADGGLGDGVEDNCFANFETDEYEKAGLRPHPDKISETTALASIPVPPVSYKMSLPRDMMLSGRISAAQFMAVRQACAKHETRLKDGSRAGFFLGDGPGVGKGRQISATILENFAKGRTRAIWLSASADLLHDARRDLNDIGALAYDGVRLLDLRSVKAGQRRLAELAGWDKGIVFSTYDLLISGEAGRSNRRGNALRSRPAAESGPAESVAPGAAAEMTPLQTPVQPSPLAADVEFGEGSRLAQLVEWCGGAAFEGLLVLDECHKAKNCLPKDTETTDGRKFTQKESKTSRAVIELQRRLRNARVLYVSATGATESENLCYMERLGLWGPGTAYPAKQDFVTMLKTYSVRAMELVAMELKQNGSYLARTLSYEGVKFELVPVRVDGKFKAMYDAAAVLWQDLLEALRAEAGGDKQKTVMGQYYGAQLRFFKQLCTAAKVDEVERLAKDALSKGHCVVIGLQSTGEARTAAYVAANGGADAVFESFSFDTTAQEIVQGLIHKYLPPGSSRGEQLARRARELALPANPLDDLIDRMGGPDAVAEMTGRTKRMERQPEGGYKYVTRNTGGSLDAANLNEKAMFQNGEKLVAVISDAASTGISLQADRSKPNQRLRVHITLELAWSADKTVQQLGRTHRSNQAQQPLYMIVSSDISGEHRFASAVAARLMQLGALTHGDRNAVSAVDVLAGTNFHTKYGPRALSNLYGVIRGVKSVSDPASSLYGITPEWLRNLLTEKGLEPGSVPWQRQRIAEMETFIAEAVGELEAVGLLKEDAEGGTRLPGGMMREKSGMEGGVNRMLNRLLAVRVDMQGKIFQLFSALLDYEVLEAKRKGEYETGIVRPTCGDIKLRHREVIFTAPESRISTTYYEFHLDRGVPWEEAMRIYNQEVTNDADTHTQFVYSTNEQNGVLYVALAIERNERGRKIQSRGRGRTAMPQYFRLIRPGTGYGKDIDREEFRRRFTRVSDERAQGSWLRTRWREEYNRNHAQRQQPLHLISGSLLPLLPTLDQVIRSKTGRNGLKVMRVATSDGSTHVLGIHVEQHRAADVVTRIRELQSYKPWQLAKAAAGQGGMVPEPSGAGPSDPDGADATAAAQAAPGQDSSAGVAATAPDRAGGPSDSDSDGVEIASSSSGSEDEGAAARRQERVAAAASARRRRGGGAGQPRVRRRRDLVAEQAGAEDGPGEEEDAEDGERQRQLEALQGAGMWEESSLLALKKAETPGPASAAATGPSKRRGRPPKATPATAGAAEASGRRASAVVARAAADVDTDEDDDGKVEAVADAQPMDAEDVDPVTTVQPQGGKRRVRLSLPPNSTVKALQLHSPLLASTRTAAKVGFEDGPVGEDADQPGGDGQEATEVKEEGDKEGQRSDVKARAGKGRGRGRKPRAPAGKAHGGRRRSAATEDADDDSDCEMVNLDTEDDPEDKGEEEDGRGDDGYVLDSLLKQWRGQGRRAGNRRKRQSQVQVLPLLPDEATATEREPPQAAVAPAYGDCGGGAAQQVAPSEIAPDDVGLMEASDPEDTEGTEIPEDDEDGDCAHVEASFLAAPPPAGPIAQDSKAAVQGPGAAAVPRAGQERRQCSALAEAKKEEELEDAEGSAGDDGGYGTDGPSTSRHGRQSLARRRLLRRQWSAAAAAAAEEERRLRVSRSGRKIRPSALLTAAEFVDVGSSSGSDGEGSGGDGGEGGSRRGPRTAAAGVTTRSGARRGAPAPACHVASEADGDVDAPPLKDRLVQQQSAKELKEEPEPSVLDLSRDSDDSGSEVATCPGSTARCGARASHATERKLDAGTCRTPVPGAQQSGTQARVAEKRGLMTPTPMVAASEATGRKRWSRAVVLLDSDEEEVGAEAGAVAMAVATPAAATAVDMTGGDRSDDDVPLRRVKRTKSTGGAAAAAAAPPTPQPSASNAAEEPLASASQRQTAAGTRSCGPVGGGADGRAAGVEAAQDDPLRSAPRDGSTPDAPSVEHMEEERSQDPDALRCEASGSGAAAADGCQARVEVDGTTAAAKRPVETGQVPAGTPSGAEGTQVSQLQLTLAFLLSPSPKPPGSQQHTGGAKQTAQRQGGATPQAAASAAARSPASAVAGPVTGSKRPLAALSSAETGEKAGRMDTETIRVATLPVACSATAATPPASKAPRLQPDASPSPPPPNPGSAAPFRAPDVTPVPAVRPVGAWPSVFRPDGAADGTPLPRANLDLSPGPGRATKPGYGTAGPGRRMRAEAATQDDSEAAAHLQPSSPLPDADVGGNGGMTDAVAAGAELGQEARLTARERLKVERQRREGEVAKLREEHSRDLMAKLVKARDLGRTKAAEEVAAQVAALQRELQEAERRAEEASQQAQEAKLQTERVLRELAEAAAAAEHAHAHAQELQHQRDEAKRALEEGVRRARQEAAATQQELQREVEALRAQLRQQQQLQQHPLEVAVAATGSGSVPAPVFPHAGGISSQAANGVSGTAQAAATGLSTSPAVQPDGASTSAVPRTGGGRVPLPSLFSPQQRPTSQQQPGQPTQQPGQQPAPCPQRPPRQYPTFQLLPDTPHSAPGAAPQAHSPAVRPQSFYGAVQSPWPDAPTPASLQNLASQSLPRTASCQQPSAVAPPATSAPRLAPQSLVRASSGLPLQTAPSATCPMPPSPQLPVARQDSAADPLNPGSQQRVVGAPCAVAAAAASRLAPPNTGAVTRDEVLRVISDYGPKGGISAGALVRHFEAAAASAAGPNGQAPSPHVKGAVAWAKSSLRERLACMLQELVDTYEVMREGAGAASSRVDVACEVTRYRPL